MENAVNRRAHRQSEVAVAWKCGGRGEHAVDDNTAEVSDEHRASSQREMKATAPRRAAASAFPDYPRAGRVLRRPGICAEQPPEVHGRMFRLP
jgi:hypothetical protein